MNDPSRSSDEELADSLSASDDHAIAALAGRYTQPLYDFALRATLDPAVASAITRSCIEHLRSNGGERPADTSVRAWTFAFAQEQVLAVATDRTRGPEVRLSAGDRRFTQTDGLDREVALWAWQAARSLRPRDYCLLDLTLRRGIAPEDVSGSAAQGRGSIYAALGRARGGFDEAYIATALYFRGREACGELTELVGGSGASMRVGIRRQIAGHVENCDICQATLEALPSAAQVFADLKDVDLPPELSEQVLAGMGQSAAAAQMTLSDAALATPEAEEALEADEPEAEPEPEIESALAPVPSEEQMWAPEEDETPVAHVPVEWEQTASPSFEPTRRAAGVTFGAAYAGRGRFARILGPLGSSLLWSYVLLGVSTAIAIYLGIAVADSLRGGGGDSGPRDLGTGSVRNIPCAGGPLTLNHGTTQVFKFDSDALDGFEIGAVRVNAESGVNNAGLTVKPQEGTALEVQAARVQATAPRTDQFLVQIDWKRGDEDGRSNCSVMVKVTP